MGTQSPPGRETPGDGAATGHTDWWSAPGRYSDQTPPKALEREGGRDSVQVSNIEGEKTEFQWKHFVDGPDIAD